MLPFKDDGRKGLFEELLELLALNFITTVKIFFPLIFVRFFHTFVVDEVTLGNRKTKKEEQDCLGNCLGYYKVKLKLKQHDFYFYVTDLNY